MYKYLKKLFFAMGISLFFFQGQSHAFLFSSSPTDKILWCARDIITGQKGGKAGIKQTGKILEKVRNAKNNEELGKLLNQCEGLRYYYDYKWMSQTDRLDYLSNLSELSTGTKKVLKGFIDPTISCTKVGAGVSVTALFGMNYKTNLNFCSDTLGRRWVEWGNGTGIKAGLGAFATLDIASEKDRNYSNGPFRYIPFKSYHPVSISCDETFSTGLVGALKWQGKPNASDKSLGGVGVGLGLNYGVDANFNIEILPLTSSTNEMKINLMN